MRHEKQTSAERLRKLLPCEPQIIVDGFSAFGSRLIGYPPTIDANVPSRNELSNPPSGLKVVSQPTRKRSSNTITSRIFVGRYLPKLVAFQALKIRHCYTWNQRGDGIPCACRHIARHADQRQAAKPHLAPADASSPADHRINQDKGGSNTVTVLANAPVVMLAPATRSDLIAGKKVFVVASPANGGAYNAQFVVVEKDGVAPPM